MSHRVIFYFSALLAAYSYVSPAWSQQEAPDRAVIALFGDSISVGFQLGIFPLPDIFEAGDGRTNFGCPDIYLGALLRNEDARGPGNVNSSPACFTVNLDSPVFDANAGTREVRDVEVVNWGVTGSDTVQGLSRISSNLVSSATQFADRTLRFALILYGTNDISSGISAQGTGFNIAQMVVRARQSGFIPVISTLLPRGGADQGGVDVEDSRIAPINQQIQTIAAQDSELSLVDLHAAFINYVGGWQQLIPIETSANTGIQRRLHPNDQGYLFIAEQWFEQFLSENIIPLQSTPIITPILPLLLEEE